MNIVIPFQGRVQTIIRSSFIAAKRESETTYNLTGDALQMAGVTSKHVLIFPDSISVNEGQTIDDELLMQSLPLESFIVVSSEEVMSNVIGLLLRSAVADGRITDAELLNVQPALDNRAWRVGLQVDIGDPYTFAGSLWCCLQPHTTQADWTPDKTPALWRKVEIIAEDAIRVWQTGIDCIVGDELAYPDENGTIYTCLQAHTTQEGWEPPITPALWHTDSTKSESNQTDA